MARRKIIKIDQELCNGCGQCMPNCPEGAIQIIDKKARLISDLFCDGLGACIGHCPLEAITIEERQAEEYDERKVMENIVKQGKNVIIAHLSHLKEHNQYDYLNQAIDFLKEKNIPIPKEGVLHTHHDSQACPGSKIMDSRSKETAHPRKEGPALESQLRQWPVQIMLVPAYAPYLNNVDLLIAADCVAFADADFHHGLLKDKTLLVGCPKLDDVGIYQEKFTQIFENNNIKSVTYAHMEVPCCFGLVSVIKGAISKSAKEIPFKEIIISIKGERLS